MKLRALLKHLASSTCAGCTARQQTLLRRALWVAARNNDVRKDTRGRDFSKRHNSTNSAGTTVQSTRPNVDFPNLSLSDFMFSRFNKFGNKEALVSLHCICAVKKIPVYSKYWQLAASAFPVNFYGARRTFAGIIS